MVRRLSVVLLALAVSLTLPPASAGETPPPEEDFYGRGVAHCLYCVTLPDFRILITEQGDQHFAVPIYSGIVADVALGPVFWLSGDWQEGWFGCAPSLLFCDSIMRVAPYDDGAGIAIYICYSLGPVCTERVYGSIDHVSLEEFIAP